MAWANIRICKCNQQVQLNEAKERNYPCGEKGHRAEKVEKIQTRTFSESLWHSVLPSPSSPCPSIRSWLALSTPVDTQYTIWAPTVSYSYSWEIPDFTTADHSPVQAGGKKKKPSISVMSGCLGWTLVFSGRNHSDGWEKSESPSSSQASQNTHSSRCPYSWFPSLSIQSLWWGTWVWLWPSESIPNFTPPCNSFSAISPFLIFVTLL